MTFFRGVEDRKLTISDVFEDFSISLINFLEHTKILSTSELVTLGTSFQVLILVVLRPVLMYCIILNLRRGGIKNMYFTWRLILKDILIYRVLFFEICTMQ